MSGSMGGGAVPPLFWFLLLDNDSGRTWWWLLLLWALVVLLFRCFLVLFEFETLLLAPSSSLVRRLCLPILAAVARLIFNRLMYNSGKKRVHVI